MSSRIFINGRVYSVSSSARREKRPVVFEDPQMQDKRDADLSPVAQPPPAVPTTFIEDTRYDVKFRIVDVLQPEAEWVAASTMLYWYSCNYDMLMEYVKKGWVDCAVLRGSAVRRFRSLNLKALVDDRVRRAVKRK